MNKRCILSYYNNKVDNKLARYQKMALDKLLQRTEINLYQICYEDNPTPDIVLDAWTKKLLYEESYNTILILDVDCVPLTQQALEYTFTQAEKNILIGNIQRTNHIDNNEHLFVGPSCMCFTKQFYDQIGRPSFEFTMRGDVGEEITYQAEHHNKEIEYYISYMYEKLPVDGMPWKLSKGLPDYGVGATFINKHGQKMFYHLYQSIFHVHNNLFYNKCIEILHGL
jgi:hypothetical protein